MDIKDINSSERGICDDHIYLLTISLSEGKSVTMKVFLDSKPEEQAFNFCKENNLDYNAMNDLTKQITDKRVTAFRIQSVPFKAGNLVKVNALGFTGLSDKSNKCDYKAGNKQAESNGADNAVAEDKGKHHIEDKCYRIACEADNSLCSGC